jgi:hypothetical protein
VATPKSWKGVVKRFTALPKEIRDYFKYMPALIEDFPWEVSLAYAFSRVELAHNMAIYCGAVKLHRAERTITKSVLRSFHMTRPKFREMFETVHGKPIPPSVCAFIESAEDIRDRALHGKKTSDLEHRKAHCDVFDYSEEFNSFVQSQSGFKPFDDLRGFKGRVAALDKSTTRWVLKGMGFTC